MDGEVVVVDDREAGGPRALPVDGDAGIGDVGAVGQEEVGAHCDRAAADDVEVVEDSVSVCAVAELMDELFTVEAVDRGGDRVEFVVEMDRT